MPVLTPGLCALLASALAAQAAPPAAPAARVEAGRVIHSAEGIRIRLPRSAAWVGSDRFDLYGVADAEIHVFAEASRDRRIRRLYWIQFESYHADRPELSYNYVEGNRPVDWHGTRTWVRSGPVSTDAPTRAGSDREHVMALLRRGGYQIPPEVMNVRMVQLLDDPRGTGRGRRELMIIYSEDLAPTGRALAELVTDGRPDADWTPLEAPLVARAMRRLRIQRP